MEMHDKQPYEETNKEVGYAEDSGDEFDDANDVSDYYQDDDVEDDDMVVEDGDDDVEAMEGMLDSQRRRRYRSVPSYEPWMSDQRRKAPKISTKRDGCMSTSKKRNTVRATLVAVLTTVLLLGLILLIFLDPSWEARRRSREIVIVLSIDGFAYRYIEDDFYIHPNLDYLMENGVTVKLKPSFPSKTFPNHWTLATGLYPESHGIIGNQFYDPDLNENFTKAYSGPNDTVWWSGGTPIWNSIQEEGYKSAVYYWPGSEVLIDDKGPNFVKAPYSDATPYSERIDQVIDWLDMVDDRRPSLYMLYFHGVDRAGHAEGPNESYDVKNEIILMDNELGRLVREINQRSYLTTHLLFVGDHGMAEIDTSRVIFIDDVIDMSGVMVADFTPVSHLWPVEPVYTAESLVEALKDVEHATAYTKDTIPERYHFRHNKRIPPVILVADVGWSITTREYFYQNPGAFKGGNHGYDNNHPDMQSVFVGYGSKFKKGEHLEEAIENVELYNIIASLFSIDMLDEDGFRKNNGTKPLVDGVFEED